jgi:hypothetical protein
LSVIAVTFLIVIKLSYGIFLFAKYYAEIYPSLLRERGEREREVKVLVSVCKANKGEGEKERKITRTSNKR